MILVITGCSLQPVNPSNILVNFGSHDPNSHQTSPIAAAWRIVAEVGLGVTHFGLAVSAIHLETDRQALIWIRRRADVAVTKRLNVLHVLYYSTRVLLQFGRELRTKNHDKIGWTAHMGIDPLVRQHINRAIGSAYTLSYNSGYPLQKTMLRWKPHLCKS